MLRASLALGALALPALAQTQVFVVDDDAGPGVDFATIQEAVDAAASGDLVLVRDGSYEPFALTGKGLSLVADGIDVRIVPTSQPITSQIDMLPVGERVLLRGFTFDPPDQEVVGDTLVVESNQGLVWIEDLVIEAPLGLPFGYVMNQGAALRVRDCDRVVVTAASITGAPGAPPGGGLESGSIALWSEDSSVFLHTSTLVPGGTLVMGGTGRPAMRVDGGFASLRDSSLFGSAGGSAGLFGSPGPGNGGPALDVIGAEVWSIGTQLVGGPGGPGPFGEPEQGDPGPPFANAGGTVVEDPALPALLTSSTVVRDSPGVLVEVDVVSEPSSVVVVLLSLDPDPEFVAAFPDAIGVGLAPLVLTAGTTDAQGQFSIASGSPQLPPGFPTWSLGIQTALVTPLSTLEFSNPSIVTFVDDTF